MVSDAHEPDETRPDERDEQPRPDDNPSLPMTESAASGPSSHPASIGRYRIKRVIGKGGFGLVFLAQDDQLRRRVAIKVPHREMTSAPADAEAYLAEARALASLDHPGIVPVHDVGSTPEFPCYFVSKYIEGTSLAQRLAQDMPSYTEAAELTATVAEALHYAHKQGLVHRDIKPGNILIDHSGRPYLVDFGLALKDSELGRGPRCAGTPAYMSPEQARGEGHRVDGRSDIYSLGAVLYQMLTGRRTFTVERRDEMLELIASQEPKPLRQVDDGIPRELERICMKALSWRASDRYTTAGDMAEDLRVFLAGKQDVAASKDIRIVPKGLRSFDTEDSDFFLELLPGPRDRNGLPYSLSFWKRRLEERDPDRTFGVGLIYGPSGCGKSSQVKAGLLPRLAENIHPVYLEATADETETRLLRGLRKACPELPHDLTLTETIAHLRLSLETRASHKVVLILDQFEQWLYARDEYLDTELADALRQCDGGNVQAVIMIRDDFWLRVSRLFRDLDIKLLEDYNSRLVDLFDLLHARKVLAEFGRAYGRLPDSSGPLGGEQDQFLHEALAGLATDGKVVSVRLALFAEMVKGKPWRPATLRELGGVSGVATAFLEETFSTPTAPPAHRHHQRAARAVLKELLPDESTNIRGRCRPQSQLLAASGYGSRPRDFADLLRILDKDLRLMTPSDPEGIGCHEDSATPTSPGQKHYQLTHDYLVPALREWLTRKQKETSRGRAELRLTESAVLWNAKPENRHLPSWWEYLHIRLLTRRREWTHPQAAMMQRAGKVQAVRWSILFAILMISGFGLQVSRSRLIAERVRVAVVGMSNSRGILVPRDIASLRAFPAQLVADELNRQFADAHDDRKLFLAYALAEPDFGQINGPLFLDEIVKAPAEECGNIATALAHDRESSLRKLRQAATAATTDENWSRKTRYATVALYLGDLSIAAEMLRAGPQVGESVFDPVQRSMFIEWFPKWPGPVERLVDVLRAVDDPALRSGVCLAVGRVEAPTADARTAWHGQWSNWYVNQSDSGTHSAAGWAARAWDLPLHNLSDDQRECRGFAWQVTPLGLTMIRIPKGSVVSEGRTIGIEADFWLSDCEVTAGQFRQFLNDPAADKPDEPEYSGHPLLPVCSVTWYGAVLFCNWLSHQEGLIPCYERDGKEQIKIVDTIHEYDAWKLVSGASGYRLPTAHEWEYACRAGTTTAYCFGESADLLDRYAVFAGSSRVGPDVVGRRLCNAWGLFDMHGNVWEWCEDREMTSSRASRGGSWDRNAWSCRSASPYRLAPQYRRHDVGFRVARVAAE